MSTSSPLRAMAAAAVAALLMLPALQAMAQAGGAPAGVPAMKPPLGTPSAAAAPATPPAATPAPPAASTRKVAPLGPVVGGFTTINWDLLVPPDWDPFKDFKNVNLGALNDGDPRAQALLKQMREAWDNAPTNAQLVGQKVRIPGFVVPLEDGKDGMTEFLLVPYFGACIHSPPPPANQVIYVTPQSPAKNLRSMDAVWISGVLKTEKTDSYMGAAGYRIDAQSVTPYQERPR